VVLIAVTTLACVLGIRALQIPLAAEFHAVGRLKGKKSLKTDVYMAPPPEQLRAMTFGYRAAVADFLWANLVLEYGLHWQEKRAFPDITSHIDSIIALEPNHPILYYFVDTMILYTPVGAHEAEARVARKYLERGVSERPYDAELRLRYGQYLAFLAPSFLTDEAEIERWRVEGANVIVRSVELGADADRALAALTILRKAGATKAARENLERLYSLTDNPEIREQLLFKARQLGDTMIASDAAVSIVEGEWRTRYPFLSRTGVLLIGPHRDPAMCAGLTERKECPRDWSMRIGGESLDQRR
jgi:hypothetical protein